MLLDHVFVYGTLKHGQPAWPLVRPYVESYEPAVITGRLYDCGPWPALCAGDGVVQGELLRLDPARKGEALAALDQFEAYDPENPRRAPYIRDTVEARTRDGRTVPAYAYFFNERADHLRPLPEGLWPPAYRW